MALKNIIIYLLYIVIGVFIAMTMLDLGREFYGYSFIAVTTLVVSMSVVIIYILRRSRRKED